MVRRKYPIWQNSGFTLLELVISLTILLLIGGGIFFYTEMITSGYKKVTLRSKAYSEINMFDDFFWSYLKIYPERLLLEGNIFEETLGGASIWVFTNTGQTKGILWGVYQSDEQKFVWGSFPSYQPYFVWYMLLGSDEIINIKNNFIWFMNTVTPSQVTYFDHTYITKFAINSFLTPKVYKVDLRFTYEVFPELVGKPMGEMLIEKSGSIEGVSFVY